MPQNLRTLKLSLFEYGRSDNGEKVTAFVNALKKSNVLASKVDDIRIVAQERDKDQSYGSHQVRYRMYFQAAGLRTKK